MDPAYIKMREERVNIAEQIRKNSAKKKPPAKKTEKKEDTPTE